MASGYAVRSVDYLNPWREQVSLCPCSATTSSATLQACSAAACRRAGPAPQSRRPANGTLDLTKRPMHRGQVRFRVGRYTAEPWRLGCAQGGGLTWRTARIVIPSERTARAKDLACGT